MEKELSKYVVLIDSEYLRDQQICTTGNTEDEDSWDDISVEGFLGIYTWDNNVKKLRSYIAKKYYVSEDILDIIKI